MARGDRVLVHCAQGRDRSVAVAVAVLAVAGDAAGGLDADRLAAVAAEPDDAALRLLVQLPAASGKATLLRCLGLVVAARPRASPSRHTLKKLHRFFLTTALVEDKTQG